MYVHVDTQVYRDISLYARIGRTRTSIATEPIQVFRILETEMQRPPQNQPWHVASEMERVFPAHRERGPRTQEPAVTPRACRDVRRAATWRGVWERESRGSVCTSGNVLFLGGSKLREDGMPEASSVRFAGNNNAPKEPNERLQMYREN